MKYIIYSLSLIVALIFIIPLISLLLGIFSFSWRWPLFLPHAWSLNGFRQIGADSLILKSIISSIHIACIVTIINLIAGIGAARYISRPDNPYTGFMNVLIFLPLFIPPYIFSMGNQITFIRLHIADSFIAVILSHIPATLPYMILSLKAGFTTLSDDMENQGKMLGADKLTIYRLIIIPHLLPSVTAGCTLSLLVSISQYLPTLIAGGGAVSGIPLVFVPYIARAGNATGFVLSALYILINGVLIFLVSKTLKVFYRKGVTQYAHA